MKKFKVILTAVLLCSFLMIGQTNVFADAPVPESDPLHPQRLTISEAGIYTLTGTMKGTVYVDPGIGEVRLIMDNADITSADEPAIVAVSGDLLTIELPENTCSRISDSPDNTGEAAIESSVPFVLEGNGCLQINGRSGYGILTKDADFSVKGGKCLIVSEDSAVKADGPHPGKVCLTGGTLFVNAGKEPDIQAETIILNDGVLLTTTCNDICSLCGCCGNKTCSSCCKTNCGEKKCCCASTTDSPGEIVSGQTENSAGELVPDESSAVNIVLSDESGNADIAEGGTYIVTGASGNGGITIAQGTKGVVLILRDLDLSSTSGAALLINSDAEVQIIIEGEVTLTDATVPEDSETYDGAAVKAENGTAVTVTGTGKLNIRGNTKNGVSMGEKSSLVIDGNMEIDVKAEKDGITSKGDVAVKKAKVTIEAENAGIHADGVLTVGEEDGTGPDLDIAKSTEGLEATVVNIQGGDINIKATEDGIDTENLNEGEAPEASVNVTGGEIKVEAGGNAIDSDGNVNLIDGKAEIHSGAEHDCIDHDGELYVSDDYELKCECSCEEGCGRQDSGQ